MKYTDFKYEKLKLLNINITLKYFLKKWFIILFQTKNSKIKFKNFNRKSYFQNHFLNHN